jgi:DNA repair protein RadD
MGTTPHEIIRNTLNSFPTLYDYQQDAVWQAILRTRKTKAKLLLVLPTAAGKSFIIAAMSACLKSLANSDSSGRKRVLMLAPGEELVEQNAEKMRDHGFDVSIFCEGLKQKDLTNDIVFGSAKSVLNSIDQFKDHDFSAVFLDEAHSTPPTVKEIIDTLMVKNPNLRVIGTTATPYRLGKGYIFRQNTFRGFDPLTDEYASDPFFDEVVFEISPHTLIEMGKIVPPIVGAIEDHYDTRGLKQTQTGQWDKSSENNVFVDGKSDLTRRILEDIIEKSKKRHGVMIFAQNIEHAELILDMLPAKEAAIITSRTKKRDRKENIRAFRSGELKYLVNVGTLTTGFDAPIADTIAMLRTTESASLFQQIIGRGIRLCPDIGKKDCLLLDYAQNMERFAPDGDIFSPEITASKSGNGSVKLVEVTCPTCKEINMFRPITELPGTVMNEFGFLVREDQETPLMSQDRMPVSGHLGAQCRHYHENPDGSLSRCPQVWSSRLCDQCGTLNAQSARFCKCCHGPLTEKGKSMGNKAFINPDALYSKRMAKVLRMWWLKTLSKKNHDMLKTTFEVQELPYVDFGEEGELQLRESEPQEITVWLSPEIKHPNAVAAWNSFIKVCGSGQTSSVYDITTGKVILDNPEFITYQLLPPMPGQQEPRFFEIVEYHSKNPYEVVEEEKAPESTEA